MSHTSEGNLTDCLPTIDQLNNAVRNVVRPVTSEPIVQRRNTERRRTVNKMYKEPPKYADIVLPISTDKPLTDGLSNLQAAQALSIEGSFTPIQPKLGSSTQITSQLSANSQISQASLQHSGGLAEMIHAVRDTPMPGDPVRAVASDSNVVPLFSQPSLNSYTTSVVQLSPGLTQQTFPHSTQGIQLSHSDPPMYVHSGDHGRPVASAENKMVEIQTRKESDSFMPGQTICVSPPTILPSVLDALNMKDSAQLFPSLQHNAGIQILSIENILGHSHVNTAPYRSSPLPSLNQDAHEYSEQTVGVSYHQEAYEPSQPCTVEGQISLQDRQAAIEESVRTQGDINLHNTDATMVQDVYHDPASGAESSHTQSSTLTHIDSEKENTTYNEEVVFELLLSKNEAEELQRVHNEADMTTVHQHVVDQEDAPPLTEGIYCLECNQMYPESKQCALHNCDYRSVSDCVVLSRAMATLPKHLNCVAEESDPVVHRIIALEDIPKGTVYGPLEGVLQNDTDLGEVNYHVKRYIWLLYENGKGSYSLDCQSEDYSNWLMFLRPAILNEEQNLVMYQNGLKFFYITSKDIKSGEELRFWFSADYAKLIDCASRPEEMYTCDSCNRNFQNATMLQRHITRQHSDDSKKKFNCQLCQKGFSTATKLSIHQRSHRGDKPFICQQCNKRFADRSNLNKHLKIHSDDRPHSCQTCGKTFRQKAHLESHETIHTGHKPFKCSDCEKAYSRQSDLNIHMRIHTKTTQYICPHCPKTFHKLQNFQKHQLTHTGERSHACKSCGRGFAQKYHLKRHEETCKGVKTKRLELNPQTGAELGLSIAKKRIQKRDQAEQTANSQS